MSRRTKRTCASPSLEQLEDELAQLIEAGKGDSIRARVKGAIIARKKALAREGEDSMLESIVRPNPDKPAPGPRDQQLWKQAEQTVRAPRVSVRREPRGTPRWGVGSPHADEEGHRAALRHTLGTSSDDVVTSTLNNLGRAIHPAFPAVGDVALSAALAMVGAAEPRNELETALAVNAAAAHQTALKLIEKSCSADAPFASAALAAAAARLMRACSDQILALDRLRRKADQVISVEHLHVHSGGRAIVANEVHPRGVKKNAGRPHRPADLSRAEVEGSPPLRCQYEGRDALPVPSGTREGEVPHSRRRSR